MAKKKDEINIRSSATEYLTYVASVGEQKNSFEIMIIAVGFKVNYG